MTPLELGHLDTFGVMTGTGKWMWLRLGRGELPLPPMRCQAPQGCCPHRPGPASLAVVARALPSQRLSVPRAPETLPWFLQAKFL